jgi:cytochrome c oxidase subunit 4
MADSHAHSTAAVADPHAHGHTDGRDHSHDAAHVAKHVKGYLYVGAALLALTGFTVFLSYVDFDHYLPGHGWNIIIGMIVATFKAGLVAAIFMHLKGERITIWRFLIFTAIFVSGLFFLTYLHWWDPIGGVAHTPQGTGTYYNHH